MHSQNSNIDNNRKLRPSAERRLRMAFVFMVMSMWAVAILVMQSCHDHPEAPADGVSDLAPAVEEETTERALEIVGSEVNPMSTPAAPALDTMPDDGCVRMHINFLGGPLGKVFRDSNYIHYNEGRALGIEPIVDDSTAWHLRRQLVRIHSCEEFEVAELHHSFPYLVPEASKLLHELGRRFNDSLRTRGGGDYRLKVTSLLRTRGTVRRLRRVNRASVDSSAHQFGTTFDISYTRFMLTRTGGVYRTQEDLKNLLAEVIAQLRAEGRCWVIYERHSGCFHITTRAPKGAARKPRG